MRNEWLARVGLVCLSLLVLATLGCGRVGHGRVTDRSSGDLLSGTYTYERPEVGNIDGCTATLVGVRIVVTAAHCVDFTPRVGAGSNTFVVNDGRRQFSYDVDRIAVFGSEPGDDDVALLHLATAVPSSVATPTPIGTAMPTDGTTISTYGYGCQDRDTQSGPFQKQRLDHAMGRDTHNLCPGDSGGPTMTSDGHVLFVNSAYIVGDGTDIFGNVVRNAGRVQTQAAAWGETLATDGAPIGPGTPPPGDPPSDPPSDPSAPPSDPSAPPSDPTPPSDPPPADPGPPSDCLSATRCEEATPLAGCGWCGASHRPVTVDGCGYPIDDCAGDFRLNPGDCADATAGASSDCVCSDSLTFECSDGSRLACPSGSRCVPGDSELVCWSFW